MQENLNLNLNNLHQFWLALGGVEKAGYFEQAVWPNHHWHSDFKQPDINKVAEGKVVATIESLDPIVNLTENRVKQHVSLTVMNLNLNPNMHGFRENNNIEQIQNHKQIKKWVETCSQAFSYQIDPTAIAGLMTCSRAKIFAYFDNQTIAGTAISFQTAKVLGIHQMGVHPDYQGQGIARQLMHHLLACAQKTDCNLVTLQASAAGLKLYRQLGFKALAQLNKLRV